MKFTEQETLNKIDGFYKFVIINILNEIDGSYKSINISNKSALEVYIAILKEFEDGVLITLPNELNEFRKSTNLEMTDFIKKFNVYTLNVKFKKNVNINFNKLKELFNIN